MAEFQRSQSLEDSLLSHPIIRLAAGLVLALVMVGFAGHHYFRNSALIKRGVNAPAKVVELKETKTRRRTVISPIVEFTDQEGKTQRAEIVAIDKNIGDEMTITYLPDKPSVAKLQDDQSAGSAVPLIYLAISLVGWAVVAYNLIVMIKYKQVW